MFDPLYFVIVAPFMLVGMWASFRVRSAYAAGARVPSRAGYTGGQVARAMLDRNDMRAVSVVVTQGMLSDHYDPRAKVVRLSPEVYGGTSLASLGIAAHEVGHAIQDRTNYPLLAVRNAAVPLANFGSQMSFLIFFVGLILSASSQLGHWVMWAAIGLFSVTVFFQVVNLPVEFDASNRAKAILVGDGFIGGDELPTVRKVLSAAAMTYVAATLTAVATLVYFILRAQGSRR